MKLLNELVGILSEIPDQTKTITDNNYIVRLYREVAIGHDLIEHLGLASGKTVFLWGIDSCESHLILGYWFVGAVNDSENGHLLQCVPRSVFPDCTAADMMIGAAGEDWLKGWRIVNLTTVGNQN